MSELFEQLSEALKPEAITVKARMVVMSHLSDAQEEVRMGYAANGTIHNLNFVKYLIMNCDLNQEIDPDEMYKKFVESMKK